MKFVIFSLIFLVGCSYQPVNDNRAGCTLVHGQGAYSLIHGVKGAVQGVHVYIGDNLKKKIKVTCNKDVQEIIYED